MQVKLIKSLILEALNNPKKRSSTTSDIVKIGAFTAAAGGAMAAARKYGEDHAAARKYGEDHSTVHDDNFLTHSNFAEGFKDAIH